MAAVDLRSAQRLLGPLLAALTLSCNVGLPEVPPPGSYRTFATPTAAAVANAPTVEFCSLVADRARYNRKLVRVKGRYEVAEEQSSLSQASCPKESVFVWSDEIERFSQAAVLKQFRTLIVEPNYRKSSLDVTFVGHFEDGATEGRRYGHMSGYLTQLIVFRVEEAVSTPSSPTERD